MDKKLILILVGIISGILIEYNISPQWNILLLGVVGIYYLVYKNKSAIYKGLGLSIILFVLLIFNSQFFTFDVGDKLNVEGEVVKVYKQYDNYRRVDVESEYINGQKIKLRFVTAITYDGTINSGDEINFVGTVEKTKGNRNFGLPNLETLQKVRRISNSLVAENITVIKSDSFLKNIRIDFINYVSNLFDENMSEVNAGIMKKLFLADSNSMDEDIEDLYSDTGIAHLLAISGLHIGILIGIVHYLLSKLALGFNGRFVVTTILLLAYGFILGFPASVSRAILMYLTMVLGEVLELKITPRSRLILSAIALLIINPYTLFDLGFQLSFGSVFGIVFIKNAIFPKTESALSEYLFTFLSVNMMIFPILAIYFNNFNLVSLLGNIFMTPIITVILILGMLAVFFGNIFQFLAVNILGLIDFFLKASNFYLSVLLKYLSLPLRISNPSLLFAVIYYAFLLILSTRDMRKTLYKYRIVLFIFCITIFISIATNGTKDSLTVGFFDVGQGDSSYINYKGYNIQIDTGGTIFGSYNPGVEVTKRALENRGVNKLDILILSHGDMDHMGGTESLLESDMVETLLIKESERGSEAVQTLKDLEKTTTVYLEQDSELRIDENLKLEFFNTKENYFNSNDNSLICLIEYKDFKILYTGDASSVIEDEIAKKIGPVDILKVSHHGSRGSTSMDFLNKTRPEYSVISVGRNNYGHPSEEILENLKKVNSKILRTDENGEIRFIIDDEISYYTYTNPTMDIFLGLYALISVIIALFIIIFIKKYEDTYEIQRL